MNSASEGNSLSKLLHDLKGPVVNISGFQGEMEEALTALTTLLQEHKDDLPSDAYGSMIELLEEDIKPCLEFSMQASEKMHQRLQQAKVTPAA